MSGRGKGKFKFRAQPRKEGAEDTAQTSTAVKLMIIGAKPTIAEVNRWQDAAMEWGGANVRNGLHKVADRTNPGELPELPELEPPDREGDGYRTPDAEDFMIMNDEEVEILDRPAFERQKSRNKERYDEDRKEFVSELTRWKKKQDEIQEDTITFYNHLKSHLSAEARTKMKEKVPNCFAVENPKILMDALRATFLTETTGVIGNRIALENSRHRVMAMRQGRAVSSSIYLESHSGELESLHQLELEAGMTEDEWEIAWSIARVIDHIIWGLDDVRFGFWKQQMQFDSANHPTPASMADLYRDIVMREEQHRSQQRYQSSTERANAYVVREQSHKKGKPKNSDGKPTDSDDSRLRDNKGKLCCFDHLKGECSYGDKCKYSHYPPAGQGQKKSKPGGAAIDAMVDKATSKKVLFNEDNRAGGGPDPAKYGAKN